MLSLYLSVFIFLPRKKDLTPNRECKKSEPLDNIEDDKFYRKELIKLFSSIIDDKDIHAGAVFAITGVWGSGKTSALNFFKQTELADKYHAIYFDTYLYRDATLLLEKYIAKILESVALERPVTL